MMIFESSFRSSLLLEHDLFRKPVSTFRDHALIESLRIRPAPRRIGPVGPPPWGRIGILHGGRIPEVPVVTECRLKAGIVVGRGRVTYDMGLAALRELIRWR